MTTQTLTSTSSATELDPDAEPATIITNLRAEIDRLRHLLLIDSLTKLANRDGLHEHVATHASPVASVLLIDLNEFKPVNDTYGHLAGDHVLKDTANRLHGVTATGRGELAVRLSGDEFVLWLGSQSTVDSANARARQRADQVTKVLDRTVDLGSGRAVAVSATVGVGVLDGAPGVGEVLALADADMYRHKPAGGRRARRGVRA